MENSAAILAYQRLITSKKILPSQSQLQALQKFSTLSTQLEKHFSRSVNPLARLFSRSKPPKGLYVYGEVGRGKSMLMDIFAESLSPNVPVLRTHFHVFMSDIHTGIKQWHDANSSKDADVIHYVANNIASRAKLLCFDEMQINDIADAMIIGRLFEALNKLGVVIVATSNRHPDELYKDGLQRDRFLPFIEMFKRQMEIYELQGDTDYRMLHIGNLAKTYFTPLSADADEFIKQAYAELSGHSANPPETIEVRGRTITPQASSGDVALFTFHSLCDADLGSEDYIELSRRFGTILLSNIPQMAKDDYNLAIRFTKLIDELYQHKCKLIATAAVPPEQLYTQGPQAFEFQRTISRLIEMQSPQYLSLQHLG